jgi:hypothetical protein
MNRESLHPADLPATIRYNGIDGVQLNGVNWDGVHHGVDHPAVQRRATRADPLARFAASESPGSKFGHLFVRRPH